MIDIHVLLLAQVLVRVVSVCIHACVRVNMCMCVMVVDVQMYMHISAQFIILGYIKTSPQ